MAYQLIDDGPGSAVVRRLSFVPFLPDGRAVLLPGFRLPSGSVGDGEHYLLDSCLRIPLRTVGFRPQRVHPYALDGDHLYVWLDGDHVGDPGSVVIADPAQLTSGPAADALHSFRHQSDESYYADNIRLLEPAYLKGTTAQAGSGSSGDADQWRARRSMIVDGIDRDGTFLDVGCANGLLLESVRDWAAERGRVVEPYGVDLAPGLVDLARRRLPQWAGRIELGNAIDYAPGRRFDFVHLLLDAVPRARRGDLVRHALKVLVEADGRLLISHYHRNEPGADVILRGLGFAVTGCARAVDGPTTAWLNR